MLLHLFILHMLSFTYTGHSFVHSTHVVFYIHGTFICSSYTCCLLHTRNIHLFILHMLSFTYGTFIWVPSWVRVCTWFVSTTQRIPISEELYTSLTNKSYICNLRLHSGMHVKEWVSGCWLTPTQQFFSYIMGRTSKFLMNEIMMVRTYKTPYNSSWWTRVY